MKTIDVKNLVTEVLATLPEPYSENVIDEVFFAIEQNDHFHDKYLECCRDLGKTKVNNAGGSWIRKELGRTAVKEVPVKLTRLLVSYSVLDTQGPAVTKKPAVKKRAKTAAAKKREELEAKKALADYYMANKPVLHPNIGLYRKEILEFLKAGVPVAEAFAKAVNEPEDDID